MFLLDLDMADTSFDDILTIQAIREASFDSYYYFIQFNLALCLSSGPIRFEAFRELSTQTVGAIRCSYIKWFNCDWINNGPPIAIESLLTWTIMQERKCYE